jgi:hypothetical protein
MSWTGENETKGQEAYRMDKVGDYRKVDTVPKNPEEIDGREPELQANDFVRETNASLEDRYGARADDSAPEGKY